MDFGGEVLHFLCFPGNTLSFMTYNYIYNYHSFKGVLFPGGLPCSARCRHHELHRLRLRRQ